MPKITELPLSSGLKNDTIFIVVNSGTGLNLTQTQQVLASDLVAFINNNLTEIHGGEP